MICEAMAMPAGTVMNASAAAGTQSDRTSGKISALTTIAYGFGDVGCNFSWMFVGNFLMFFYTDICGISMMAVSTLLLISRFWDALNDPIIGLLSDKTRTRFGRFRPWLLFGAPITSLLLSLTFWNHPGMSEQAKIVYMYVTYCLLVLGYTSVNLPYGALLGTLTQNTYERAKLNTSRSVCAMIAINVINIITLPLIYFFSDFGGGQSQGYLMIAILYGIIFTSCHWFTFSRTKEVVQIKAEERAPVLQQLKLVLKNRPFLIAVAGQFLFGVTWYGRNADLLYYFKYVEGNESLFTVFSAVIVLPSIIGAAVFPLAFRIIGNKGRVAALFAALSGLTIGLMFFTSVADSAMMFYALAVLSNFALCAFNTSIYAIIPDCVEYGQWKTGVRNDGFQYAFISLFNKFGMAIGTSVLALVLGLYGYVPNAEQNADVIMAIRYGFSLAPAAVWVIAAVTLFFYNIDARLFASIVRDLASRRVNAEMAAAQTATAQ